MYEYIILIQYEKKDNVFVSYIPDLPGCVAHGNTPEESIKELSTAYDLWIETAKEVGKKIPLPKLTHYVI